MSFHGEWGKADCMMERVEATWNGGSNEYGGGSASLLDGTWSPETVAQVGPDSLFRLHTSSFRPGRHDKFRRALAGYRCRVSLHLVSTVVVLCVID